jgi:hypothetical protein
MGVLTRSNIFEREPNVAADPQSPKLAEIDEPVNGAP